MSNEKYWKKTFQWNLKKEKKRSFLMIPIYEIMLKI